MERTKTYSLGLEPQMVKEALQDKEMVMVKVK